MQLSPEATSDHGQHSTTQHQSLTTSHGPTPIRTAFARNAALFFDSGGAFIGDVIGSGAATFDGAAAAAAAVAPGLAAAAIALQTTHPSSSLNSAGCHAVCTDVSVCSSLRQ